MANVIYLEKKMVTPIGEAMYPKINTTYDSFEEQRKYTISLFFPEADEIAMKAMFDKWLADAKELPDNKGKKWRSLDDPRIGYAFNEKLGKTLFTFKTNAFRMVDGVETQNTVALLDVYGRPYPKTTSLGNGSKVQVQYDAAWYYKSKDGNGLSMFLSAIMVHELVEYNGNSSSAFEFKKPDASAAFSANTTPDNIDDPFGA
jgi:hypothetical protein